MSIILFIFWLILNSRFTADAGMLEICIVGVIAVAVALFFAGRAFGYTIKTEIRIFKKIPLLFAYFFVLLKEIFISNIKMIKIILNPKTKNHPVLIRTRIPLKSEFARTVLANSITLTPGTITAELENDNFTIHCIDISFAEGLSDGTLVKILERLEK